MSLFRKNQKKSGQTAVEYSMLFAITAFVALLAFKTFIPKSQIIAGSFFNEVANKIMGDELQDSDIP